MKWQYIVAIACLIIGITVLTSTDSEAATTKKCNSALTCKPNHLAGVTKPGCTSAFTCKPNHLARVKAPALPNTGK